MIRDGFSNDAFMKRKWIKGQYVCFDFVEEVWRDMTGEDLKRRLPILRHAPRDRVPKSADLAEFEKIDAPVDPCIVMMRTNGFTPHIGIHYHRRILHLTERFGVLFQRPEICFIGYKRVAYYR